MHENIYFTPARLTVLYCSDTLKQAYGLLGGVPLPLGLGLKGGALHVEQRGEGGVVQVLLLASGVHARRQAGLLT
jgi:hypothetical protein